MKADIDLEIGRKTFTSGLLPELVAVLRRSRPGDLVAVIGDEDSIGPELETWCRFTGNALLEATIEKGRARWVFRCGTLAVPAEDNRPVGSRLWLYTNFDCNLRCDYCCVRSSAMINRPSHRRDCGAGRRACAGYDGLGAARVYPPGPAPRDAAKHASTPAAGHWLSAGATSLWKSVQ